VIELIQLIMADEIRELMNKKDEIEKEIKENLDLLQSVGDIGLWRCYVEWNRRTL